MKNRALRWLYLKTGLVSALVALVTTLQVDFEWGGRFAIAALFGLANWFFLGGILVSLTERRPIDLFTWLSCKVFLLVVMLFLVLPQIGLQTSSFLCGFNMFLIVAFLDSVGQLLIDNRTKDPNGRPLPKDLRSLLMGTATDA